MVKVCCLAASRWQGGKRAKWMKKSAIMLVVVDADGVVATVIAITFAVCCNCVECRHSLCCVGKCFRYFFIIVIVVFYDFVLQLTFYICVLWLFNSFLFLLLASASNNLRSGIFACLCTPKLRQVNNN